jgi:hypothetical protein
MNKVEAQQGMMYYYEQKVLEDSVNVNMITHNTIEYTYYSIYIEAMLPDYDYCFVQNKENNK